LIRGLKGDKEILGFSVLKGHDGLADEVRSFENRFTNWHILDSYHHGGYGKLTPELTAFIDEFTKVHAIPIEFVYTAKMFFGIFDLARKGYFKRGSTLLAIHTGGVTRNASM